MAKLELLEKKHVADNVWSFVFDAHPGVHWTAGEFIRVELPHDHPDTEGTKRWFTVSAAPFEKHPQISTRVTGTTFKQALANLPVGGELELLEAPSGDFVWEERGLPMVFVAAGIGITPFRSILAERHHRGEKLPVTLIYGNRTEAIPFKEEFDEYAREHPEFTVQYVTGQMLTATKLMELVPELKESLVYVSGPEPMVEAIGDELREQGMPDQNLKQDFFPNYDEKSGL
jgi:ferredoxin-NADP reductase